ncbi:MAG TPA: phosphatase PAP2 family protein [Vicinamibacterales bacterium]|nr:phosphatase PAP2 family protein [Vicinamibacterales bacterium]
MPSDRSSRDRRELRWLLEGLAFCALLLAFVVLAGYVMAGDTQAFDVGVLRALRDPANLAQPRGPAWLEFAMLDLTALGSSTVLTLMVVAVAGFLVLQARHRLAVVVLVAAASGELLDEILKHVFMRPRPTIVPHLREVLETSFPSGHAMESAIVYLTLGAMMMRMAERRATKAYCLGLAIVVTLLVGISRIYLGVHYPTDVLAGWMVGFLWAWLCSMAVRRA